MKVLQMRQLLEHVSKPFQMGPVINLRLSRRELQGMRKFPHTLTRKLQSPLEPSERNFMMSAQEGELLRQAMLLP